MNYYRRYIGDYMRDTATLSMTEHGAYALLLDYAYATEQPIPSDRDEVFRLLRAFTGEERKAVDKVLSRFWTLGPDGYRNPRVDEELAKAVHLIEKQKANGSLGGRPKKTQTITQVETQTITQNNQPPTTNHQPPTANHQPLAANLQKVKSVPAGQKTPVAPSQGREKTRKTAVPETFAVSERVLAWAADKGHTPYLDMHLESFVGKCQANGYRYADLDAAFMSAIRDNWAKIGQPVARGNGGQVQAPVSDPNAGTIVCETCGTRTRSYTGRQCDPCWRKPPASRAAA